MSNLLNFLREGSTSDTLNDPEEIIAGLGNILIPLVVAFLAFVIIFFIMNKNARDSGGKSLLGWIGASILVSIPIISIICLLVWSFGEKTKEDPTFRSWARLNLCGLIFFVLFIIASFITGSLSMDDIRAIAAKVGINF